jgi:RNA recognition motif-containing protein
LAICVRNLPLRSSDTSLKDGLFHEYKKHGKVVTVKVAGQGTERVAIVRFKKAEDVEKALEVSRDKLFFGCKIEVVPWDSGLDLDDNEFRPLEADLDEYHPKATRTLFIGNLEKDVTSAELRQHFECFGPIIEIDIKKQSQSGANSNAYAFCQYADIASVVRAMRHLDGEQVGNTRVKLGFGKSMPTNCVWLHGVAESVAEKFLARHMSRFGHVSYAAIDRERCNGLVFYDQVSCAQAAVQELRGRALAGRKLQVDFASRECQAHFFELIDREPRGAASHRLPASVTPTSTRTVVRTPSCSSRSSTHSKERTGSSSSR